MKPVKPYFKNIATQTGNIIKHKKVLSANETAKSSFLAVLVSIFQTIKTGMYTKNCMKKIIAVLNFPTPLSSNYIIPKA